MHCAIDNYRNTVIKSKEAEGNKIREDHSFGICFIGVNASFSKYKEVILSVQVFDLQIKVHSVFFVSGSTSSIKRKVWCGGNFGEASNCESKEGI